MITNKGKSIVARSLANQAQSPFSYMALGVGAKPEVPVTVIEKTASEWTGQTLAAKSWGLETDTGLAKYNSTASAVAWSSLSYIADGIQYENEQIKNKIKLDFEAIRIPVSGASVVFESGKTKVSLTGQVPSAQRFEFTEVGIFSAEFNSILTTENPKMIYTFSASEGWEYHTSSSINPVQYVGSISENQIDIQKTSISSPVFIAADNNVFYTQNRKNQRMRVYQDALIIPGNLNTINSASSEWTISGDNRHVHVLGIPLSIGKARPDDEFKIAFAVLSNLYEHIDNPADAVKIMIVFKETEGSSEYAKIQINLTNLSTNNNTTPSAIDFQNNGYYVYTLQKKDLKTTTGFIGDNISVAQVYVEVDPATGLSADDYCVAIDAVRFESNNDNNPTYGMTAYSVIQNASANAETKEAGVEAQIEYKVVLEV